jgi:hypothetical protein
VVEKKDQSKIHIILDAAKVNRCIWCGSAQSDKWIHGEEGMLCSEECSKAKQSENFSFSVFVTFFSVPVILMVWFLPDSFDGKLLGFVSLIILEIVAIMVLISDYKDRKYALDIPKGSRNHVGVSEVSLLRRFAAPVECPNCDAKIDLTNVGEDLIYHCSYCGANGVVDIEILK